MPTGGHPENTVRVVPFGAATVAVSEHRRATSTEQRRPDGTLLPGHTLTMKTGLHSQRLLDTPDVAAWHTEQVRAIEEDLGGAEQLSALQRGIVREAARVEVILASLGDDLLTGGVLTAKGKTRAHASLYLKVLDRYANLVKVLGLKRQARRVNALKAATLNQPSAGGAA